MRLVIVNGMPGVGKSTLAAKLSDDLKLPYVSKDMLKEFLFDQVGTQSFEDSRFLGKAAIKMLYSLVGDYLADSRSLIIENAFYSAFAAQEIEQLIDGKDVEVIEVYCNTNEQERHKRISERLARGTRHPGHYDKLTILEVAPETYSPLSLGEVVQYDTTTNSPDAYVELLKILQ